MTASKSRTQSIRCRNCKGTGVRDRCACYYCVGKGSIDWQLFIESLELLHGASQKLAAEVSKLRREAKLAKAREAEMSLIVDDYLKSLAIDDAGEDGRGHRLVMAHAAGQPSVDN